MKKFILIFLICNSLCFAEEIINFNLPENSEMTTVKWTPIRIYVKYESNESIFGKYYKATEYTTVTIENDHYVLNNVIEY